MSNYSDLFQSIKMKVCQNNNFSSASLSGYLISGKNNHKENQIWYRIGQIFTLECVLEEYRKQSSTHYFLLDNEKALHHMIFHITKWKPEDIRALSLNDCLFIISDKLKPEYMAQEAAEFLARLKLPSTPYPTDHFSGRDWTPRENSGLLQSL